MVPGTETGGKHPFSLLGLNGDFVRKDSGADPFKPLFLDFSDGSLAMASLYACADSIVISPPRNPCSWAVEQNTRSNCAVSESYMRSK